MTARADCDVLIVGGGHNGLVCAAYLAGAGLKVRVLERRAIVGGAAVEEGVVPGGGVALVRALQAIGELKGINEDQNHGIVIALRAMEAPLREIVTNCGEEPSVVLNAVKQGTGSYGYNAATGEYGDMIAMGILDPTKVTRTALQNAASIAGLMITTEAMVAEAPKKMSTTASVDSSTRSSTIGTASKNTARHIGMRV